MSHRTYLNTGNAGTNWSSLLVQKWGDGNVISPVTEKPEVVEFTVKNRDGSWANSVRLDIDQVDDLISLLTNLRDAIPMQFQKEVPQVIFRD